MINPTPLPPPQMKHQILASQCNIKIKFIYKLGLYLVTQYQWQRNDENDDEFNELMMWKLSSIWMKILNDATQKCNWIQMQFDLDWIQINSNSIDSIQKQIGIKLNSIQI